MAGKWAGGGIVPPGHGGPKMPGAADRPSGSRPWIRRQSTLRALFHHDESKRCAFCARILTMLDEVFNFLRKPAWNAVSDG
jgi:hypothetical protein